jgi:hypothetical protein
MNSAPMNVASSRIVQSMLKTRIPATTSSAPFEQQHRPVARHLRGGGAGGLVTDVGGGVAVSARASREQPLGLAGEAVVDVDVVAVRARLGDRVEVAPAVRHEVGDGAHEPAEDDADDEAEREDTEEAAGVGREEEAEQEPPEEAEHPALPDPGQCGAASRQAPRDLLDIAEPGADDPHVLDREALIGQPVCSAAS